MTGLPRIAFYAPMKSPNHPVPSGDRQVGRLFVAALESAGYQVDIASEFRAYEKTGGHRQQEEIQRAGAREAVRLIDHFRRHPELCPELWFTYHLYHKAPDWLGPTVSKALKIPYVIAEGSHAPKQSGGPWDLNYKAAEAALQQADQVLCMTRLDLACIEKLRSRQPSLWFPPFLDTTTNPEPTQAKHELAKTLDLDAKPTWLLTVAMMRPRDKLPSYRILAAALSQLKNRNWRLLIVGDGPARDEVEALFQAMAEQVRFAGEQPTNRLGQYYAAADIYVWPAVNEAYGMAFLEAQAAGAAVVAGDEPGVRDVIKHGETGLLTTVGDVAAFSQTLDDLLSNRAHRQQLAKKAAAFVQGGTELDGRCGALENDNRRVDQMTELALIRHGRTEWNKTGQMTGRSDIPLAPEGRAEVAARVVPTMFDAAAWHTSPLKRTRQTAALLGHEAARVEPCLIEMDFGVFEGRTLENLRGDVAIDMAGMEDMGLDFLPPQGESPRMVRARLQPFFDKLVSAGGLHVAVAHKSVIRAVMADAYGWDMMGKPPVKLRWEHIHLFTLDELGQPKPKQMNIPFLESRENLDSSQSEAV